nr:hypothetical protein [Tanacetum cinerariifolium]
LYFNVEVKEHSLGDKAMNAEIQSMYDNKVWKLVDLPPGAKVVKRKWIYKKKTGMDGVVYIYKARLVAKGFTQTYGVDYEETFSPVADIRAIRILIAIAAYYDYEIWQIDVKTALLNGDAAYIGIKIYRDRSRWLIGLSQDAYLDKILKRYRMDGSKRGAIPLQVDCHLDKSQCAESKNDKARSIMYAVRYTRPDVAFAQNITSRFQQSPGEAHWTAVKNILKYLRRTKDMFLVYGGNSNAELQVKCYCDAGFETDRDDTKSQTGYVFTLNGGAVVWKSSKQRARHFQRKFHYVRDCVETGEIKMVKVHTDDNLADPFTKALAGPRFTRHTRIMGLRPATSFM